MHVYKRVVVVTMTVQQGTHTHIFARKKKDACDDDDPGIMTQA